MVFYFSYSSFVVDFLPKYMHFLVILHSLYAKTAQAHKCKYCAYLIWYIIKYTNILMNCAKNRLFVADLKER